MDYQTFLDQIKEYLANHFKEATICIHKIIKNNDYVLDALSIMEPDKNITPTIYLNSYYEDLKAGDLSFHEIIDHIIQTHVENSLLQNVDVNFFLDFNNIKDHIVFRIVNFKMNQTLLREIPHIPYLDLAICFHYLADFSSIQQGTILIRNEHLKMWHISDQEIYELARKNTPTVLPPKYLDMNHVMQLSNFERPMTSLSMDELPNVSPAMFVISNSRNLFGASCLIYENLLREISEKLHSSLIILPSSIHEIIVVPCLCLSDLHHYSQLVKQVNRMHLEHEEILSDHAYYYDYEMHTLSYQN